jgi:hypothetical protein
LAFRSLNPIRRDRRCAGSSISVSVPAAVVSSESRRGEVLPALSRRGQLFPRERAGRRTPAAQRLLRQTDRTQVSWRRSA